MTERTFCRICLDVDVRMFQISDTGVQDMYEKLTNKKIQKGERLHACFICHHQLRKCQQLLVKAWQSDELLKQMSVNSKLDLKPIFFVNRMTYSLVNPLVVSRVEYFETPKCCDIIKTENQSENEFDASIVKDEPDEKIVKDETDERDEKYVKYEPDVKIFKEEPDVKIIKEEPDVKIVKDEPDQPGDYSAPTNKTEMDEKHILDQDKNNSIDRGMKENVVGTETNTVPNENNSSKKICDRKSNQIVIGDKKCFTCNDCDKTFNMKALLIKHISEHKPVILKPLFFKCQHCSVTCGSRAGLKAHVRIHTRQKCFKCPYCDYSAIYKSKLETHIRAHTGDKPFKCPYCDHSATHKTNLEVHIRTHTGEKPFKCPYCDYKCIQNSSLKRHIRTHTGEKPFKCPYCDYSSARKTYLATHVTTHTGEKPFKCPLCDYSSARKTCLATHIRIHSREKS